MIGLQMMVMKMTCKAKLKKVRKNDVVKLSTKYFKDKRYLVESNQYSKEIMKVIPLELETIDEETAFSISLPWEMIEDIGFEKKEYVLYFLNHSSTKILDQIKSIIG